MKTIKLTPGVYNLENYSYVPMIDSFGTCCENCGKLISNIATISDIYNNHYIVGLDCAKTILNETNYNEAKKGISKKKKCLEKIKSLELNNRPFVLNENGWPCYPPETRSGYMIMY